MDEQKPGWQTTEWWGKNAVQLATAASAIAAIYGKNLPPDQVVQLGTKALTIIAALEGIYTAARTWLKSR